MSLIEGVGDEVTAFFAIVVVLSIIFLAWVSTNIRDIPFFSVIIVELTHGRRRAVVTDNQDAQEDNTEATHSENDPEVSSTETSSEDSLTSQEPELLAQSGGDNQENKNNVQEENAENSISETPNDSVLPSEDGNNEVDLSETELRQRRLEFFQKKKVTGTSDSTASSARTKTEADDISQSENASDRQIQSMSQSECVSHNQSGSDLNPSQSSSLNNTCREESGIKKNSSDVPLHSSGSNERPDESSSVQNIRDGTGDEDTNASQINIRLKYLNDTQRSVTASPADTVGQFRRYIILSLLYIVFYLNG